MSIISSQQVQHPHRSSLPQGDPTAVQAVCSCRDTTRSQQKLRTTTNGSVVAHKNSTEVKKQAGDLLGQGGGAAELQLISRSEEELQHVILVLCIIRLQPSIQTPH